MDRNHLLVGLVAVCIVNGIFSPFVPLVLSLWPLWYPTLAPATPLVLFYLSSLIVSTATLVIAGVPAALYERLAGMRESDTISMLIWIGCAVLLSIPGFVQADRLL